MNATPSFFLLPYFLRVRPLLDPSPPLSSSLPRDVMLSLEDTFLCFLRGSEDTPWLFCGIGVYTCTVSCSEKDSRRLGEHSGALP